MPTIVRTGPGSQNSIGISHLGARDPSTWVTTWYRSGGSSNQNQAGLEPRHSIVGFGHPKQCLSHCVQPHAGWFLMCFLFSSFKCLTLSVILEIWTWFALTCFCCLEFTKLLGFVNCNFQTLENASAMISSNIFFFLSIYIPSSYICYRSLMVHFFLQFFYPVSHFTYVLLLC